MLTSTGIRMISEVIPEISTWSLWASHATNQRVKEEGYLLTDDSYEKETGSLLDNGGVKGYVCSPRAKKCLERSSEPTIVKTTEN